MTAQVDLPRSRRGDSFDWTFVFQDQPDPDVAPVPRNLTGYTIAAQWRRFPDAGSPTSFTVTVDAPAGEIVLTLAAAATARLCADDGVYDVQAVDELGAVETLVAGRLPFVKDVTRP